MASSLKQIGILGAGVSGLAAIKSCLEEGLEPICFEQYDKIGGIWNYSEELRENQGAAAFYSLTTNTSKEISCFSDYPFQDDTPEFIPHATFQKYLQHVANHFDLNKYIQFNTTVISTIPSSGGGWEVSVRKKGKDEVTKYEVDGVMVCTGRLRVPKTPDIPGLDGFTGTLMHMKDYRTPHVFTGKRVLIVGNQNSAGDACTDAAKQASQVFWSVGEGTWLMSRFGSKSIPHDLRANRLLSKIFTRRILGWGMRRIAFDPIFNQSQYGLGHPRNPVMGAPFLVNDGLMYDLKTGRVLTRPRLVELSGNMACFSDGSQDEVDFILFATGFDADYSFVDSPYLKGSKVKDFPLYKWTFPIHDDAPTLALIGGVSTVGAQVVVIELQTRWAARVFAGRKCLPPASMMKQHREEEVQEFDKNCLGKPTVIGPKIQEELSEEIGVNPKIWDVFWNTKSLHFLLLVFLGPILPVHYRIQGPGCFKNAKELSYQAYYRAFYTPDYHRKDLSTPIKSSSKWIVAFFLVLAVLAGLYILNIP